MEWLDAKTLQLSELCEERPTTKSQRATGQSQRMQLYRATLLHTRATKLRDKIAGVTSVLYAYYFYKLLTSGQQIYVVGALDMCAN